MSALVRLLSEAPILTRADPLVRDLAAASAAPGEPVLVSVANRPGDITAYVAAWQAGLVAVPVHAAAPAPAVDKIRQATGARFLIEPEGIRAMPGEASPRSLPNDAALVIFTSGSTGLPKGVVIGHSRLAGKLEVLQRLLGFTSRDVVVVPLQLTFIFGIWVSLLALLAGARLILVPKFSTAAFAEPLAGATIAAVVPTMLRSLLASAPPLPAPSLRTLLTGGEPLGANLARRIAETYPPAGIFDLYGSTETGSCDFCLTPADQPDGFGTIGRPTEQVSFRIVDGELQIRTPFGMLGYLDAQATAAAMTDGFFGTGDLVRATGNGRVELVGRRKEVISRGGAKIAPLELDFLFASHPGVEAALCGGVPDERRGEAVHVLVMPRAGAHLEPEALRAWAAERIEGYKLPDVIHVVDQLPAGSTGKADRSAVAALVYQLMNKPA